MWELGKRPRVCCAGRRMSRWGGRQPERGPASRVGGERKQEFEEQGHKDSQLGGQWSQAGSRRALETQVCVYR